MTEKNDDNFLLSFSDLWLICKESKYKILAGALCLSLLTISYLLTRPITYVAEATFREKASKMANANPFSAAQLFLNGNTPSGSETISLMKSRMLMEKLAEKRNLQASLFKKGSELTLQKRIGNNLKVLYHNFRNRKSTPIVDLILPIKIKQIVYYEEVPTLLNIFFLNEDVYEITDAKGKKIGNGNINFPFETKDFRFTIHRINNEQLALEHFQLVLEPLADVAKRLSDQLNVESEKMDSGLIKLSLISSNRYEASDLLNTFMSILVDHIKRENKRISREQLDYLQVRQDEISLDLKKKMESHADHVSHEVSTSGFPDSSHAIDFLSHYQQQYQDQLFTISIEEQRLQQAKEKEPPQLEKFLASTENDVIRMKLDEIRNLKINAISIDLALKSSPDLSHNPPHETFHDQMEELAELRSKSLRAKKILADLGSNSPNVPSFDFGDSADPLEQKWYRKLNEKKLALAVAKEDQKTDAANELKKCQNHFCSYLENLIHMYYVQEKTLEERISHQRAPLLEFQALDSENAKIILFNYTKEIKDLEFKIAQNQFLINQLQQPNFELSTLATIVSDTLSTGIAQNSSELILTLMDDNYRSIKDKSRLQDELSVKKEFIQKHLEQGIQIFYLQIDLLKDKIASLQNIRLANIQQQISIFEKQLRDYASVLVENMNQERLIITQHQDALQKEIAKLPLRWVSEKLLDQQVEINKRMIEEVTSLVESKNISNNLDSLQSSPLDVALTPLPKPPKLFLMAILGGVGGALIGLCVGFVQNFANGIRATRENLQLAHQHVAGAVSCKIQENTNPLLLDQDLETLRRLISYLCASNALSGENLLILTGRGPDYSKHVASLLSKQGKKVLLLSISFDSISLSDQLPGLLQYLEGKAPEPLITKNEEYHAINAGGINRFSSELLNSHSFQNLLAKLLSQYDWVIAVSNANILQAEGESLIKQFNNIAVNITEEKLQDLQKCISLVQNSNSIKKLSFVISNVC
jgi:tyrosine-protein kinase Etk/Wzc